MTATPFLPALGLAGPQLSIAVKFDLVAPPKSGDLAGLALEATVLGSTSEPGTPGEISVRPSSSPAGVGLDIAFTNLPDTYPVAGVATPIAVDELNSTLDGLRLPASCPTPPANVTVTADSYSAPTTQPMASAPLRVTNCAQLSYRPAFTVTAVKDPSDNGVGIVSDITQPSAGAQATSRTVALTLPSAVFTPNVTAVLNDAILCATSSSGTCKTVGTASSTSPLYPKTLNGEAYLTGSLTAPAIALVFPAPFALTLSGSVSLATSTTTFGNLPDLPLTDLKVTLAPGPNAVFVTSCATPSGTRA